MADYESFINQLEMNKKKIKNFGVNKIGLFGSHAHGKPKLESDIDILVEFKTGSKTFDNYMDLRFFLEELFGGKVDLVLKEALKPGLKDHILGNVKYAAGI